MASVHLRGQRRNHERRFVINYFALFTILGVVLPYFQKLLFLQGFNEKRIGYILAAFHLAGIFASPFMGWVSDRSHHRKTIVIVLALGTCVNFVAFGSITTFWIALATAVVMGVFFWPLPPLTDGLVLRHMSKHGGDYGKSRSAGSIAFILSIVVIELLGAGAGGDYSLNLIVTAGGICCIFYAAVSRMFPLEAKEKEKEKPHFDWSVLRSKQFLFFLMVVFLTRFGMTGYYSFFTLFLQKELGFQQAGYLWTLATLSEVPVIFFSSAIIKRIGVRNMFALGIAATSARLMGLSYAPNVYWVIPLQFLHALTFGAFFTASIHYLDRVIPRHMKQSATAILSSVAFGLPAIMGSALGGELVYNFGFRYMYRCYSLLALAALFAHFLLIKEPKKKKVSSGLEG